MAQTRSQCLSSSGINEEKADEASSESSHGNDWFYLRLYAFSRHGVKNVAFQLLPQAQDTDRASPPKALLPQITRPSQSERDYSSTPG
jgi:hypothetical protein